MAAAEPAFTACSIAVSAPSSRISAQANGCASGWPASGLVTHDQVVTPPGPDLHQLRRGLGRDRVVLEWRGVYLAVGPA